MDFDFSKLTTYVEQFFFWFGTIVASASIIVKATPTQKDDNILAKVVKILDALSIFNPNGKKVIDSKENSK